MHSGEGEVVPFSEKLYPTGNVEDWLCEVERVMKKSLKDVLYEALEEYPDVLFCRLYAIYFSITQSHISLY